MRRRKNRFWLLKLLWRMACWAWDWSPLPGPTEPPSDEARELFYKSKSMAELSTWCKDYYGDYCLCCGVTSESETIVCDHIKPVRKYWHLRLSRDNVQPLCNPCNLEKGSDSEADFRRLDTRIVISSPAFPPSKASLQSISV